MSQSLTSGDSGRLRIRSVVEQVYDALLERVLSGDIPRGARLPQGALAEEMGVSRTPLREALRRLSAEGFVEFSPNQGATVSQLDLGDMRHAWTARLTLEPAAARLAAANADAADVARMRRAVQQQRLSADDRAAGFAANREFHLTLVAASGNPHLTRFAEMLWVSRIGAWIYSAQAADAPGETALWADEHDTIADAVEARDADLVERLTRAHIEAHPPAEVV
jgi:DNA-binding GntR family transcriptional regulator